MTKMNQFFAVTILTLLTSSFTSLAFAGDLEWSGLYRIEGNSIAGPQMDSSVNKRKEYGVHTLILRPKIVAADGLYINAQLNIFNSDKYNQLGAYFGNGLGEATPTTSNNSNATSENEQSEELRVSQFYLTQVQEHGALIAGRAPVHFGLGITHSAGRGLFDHFSDTRDLVGYKMSFGNFFFYPMYAKINEGGISGYDDVNEWNFQFQYENPESDVAMGVFYQNRKASRGGNDAAGSLGAATVDSEMNTKNFNIYYEKNTPDWHVGFEIGQSGGDSGVKQAGEGQISFSGFALATEFEYHPKENKNAYGLKAGMASGDDPSTADDFEGFIFDRNYDVAMLLFNHGLGQGDVLHTSMIGRNDSFYSVNSTVHEPDTEAISNVFYVAPYWKRRWSDRWSMDLVLATGWIDDDTVGVGNPKADKDLGYEVDFSLNYNVSEKILWQNQIGILTPGGAWEAGGTFDVSTVYGFVSRAAVSF